MARIVNNDSANAAYKTYVMNNKKLASSTEKLASGLKINRAADDPGGLGISETLRGVIRGTSAAIDNLNDAEAFANAADGFMQTAHDILSRMKEIAIRYDDGALSSGDKGNLVTEWGQLNTQFSSQFSATYNGTAITTGRSFTTDADGSSLSLTVSSTSAPGTTVSRSAIDTAITSLSTNRATIGAFQSRVQFVLASQQNYLENIQNSEGIVRNVDMARESTTFAKYQILSQSSTAMLSQANSLPQNVLSLLR